MYLDGGVIAHKGRIEGKNAMKLAVPAVSKACKK
jgi:hypothetical protein